LPASSPKSGAQSTAGARSPDRAPTGRKVRGLDFGFHNPFAAIWGVLDHDDRLWLTGEHYEAHRRDEMPEDDNNHALGALRYLIAKLDARKLGRKAKSPPTPPQTEQTEKPKEKNWLSLKNEALWEHMRRIDQ
jgi:hypothetical protein